MHPGATLHFPPLSMAKAARLVPRNLPRTMFVHHRAITIPRRCCGNQSRVTLSSPGHSLDCARPFTDCVIPNHATVPVKADAMAETSIPAVTTIREPKRSAIGPIRN